MQRRRFLSRYQSIPELATPKEFPSIEILMIFRFLAPDRPGWQPVQQRRIAVMGPLSVSIRRKTCFIIGFVFLGVVTLHLLSPRTTHLLHDFALGFSHESPPADSHIDDLYEVMSDLGPVHIGGGEFAPNREEVDKIVSSVMGGGTSQSSPSNLDENDNEGISSASKGIHPHVDLNHEDANDASPHSVGKPSHPHTSPSHESTGASEISPPIPESSRIEHHSQPSGVAHLSPPAIATKVDNEAPDVVQTSPSHFGGHIEIAQPTSAAKLHRTVWIRSAVEAQTEDPFDLQPIKDLCSRSQWREGLIIYCKRGGGGVADLRNQLLNGIRLAIEAGGESWFPIVE